MSVLIYYPKDPQIYFDGSYFFYYLCNMKYVLIYLISALISIVWLRYEVWKSPMMDNDGNIIRPEKKFNDLFKRK